MWMLIVLGLQIASPQPVSVTPGDRFKWDTMSAVDLARSYRYEVELDGQVQKDPLADVQCEPAKTLVRCTAPYPAVGQHLMRVRPVDVSIPGLPAVEGLWMSPIYYVMRPVPAPMVNVQPVVKPKGA